MTLGTMRDISFDHARKISMLANWATFAGAVAFVGAILLGMI
jgi:hypothetical protein